MYQKNSVVQLTPYMKLRQNGIVSFPIRLAVFQARGGARMKLRLAGTVKRLNVEHRTSNIERRMFDVHFLVNPSYETSQGQSFFYD